MTLTKVSVELVRCSIGIDVGGTKTLGAIVCNDGRIVHQIRCATPANERDEVVQTIVQLAKTLANYAAANSYKVIGIGVGTAGQVNFETGVVVSGTSNIRDWMNVNLRTALEPIGLPVWVDNDVNVHLLAETRLGVAVGLQHVLMLVLGTGVGGAAWEDGRLIRGDWGAACEFGHISVDYHGPICNCGSRGCLELYASGTGIARMMRERLAQVGGSKPSSTIIDARDVLQSAKAGDPLASAVVHEMVDALSMACVSLIHAFNPQMIVLGGGVMEGGEWLLEHVRERVKKRGISSLVDPVAIVTAQFGTEAGVVGAALQSFLYEETL